MDIDAALQFTDSAVAYLLRHGVSFLEDDARLSRVLQAGSGGLTAALAQDFAADRLQLAWSKRSAARSRIFRAPRRPAQAAAEATDEALQCADCTEEAAPKYHQRPGLQLVDPCVEYHQLPAGEGIEAARRALAFIVAQTPKPKGHARFSTIEVVTCGGASSDGTHALSASLLEDARPTLEAQLRCPVRFHQLAATGADPVREWSAIFELETRMMLLKANRQSLVVWVGCAAQPELDGFAGFIGMLPFRGIAVALVSGATAAYPDPSASFAGFIGMLPFRGIAVALVSGATAAYPDPFRYATPSGVLAHDSHDPVRMGLCPVKALFGPLPDRSFTAPLAPWRPMFLEPSAGAPMTLLPFKIAGLSLPMITYTGQYDDGIAALAAHITAFYGRGGGGGTPTAATPFFPIVSCGETVDRLGYADDLLRALGGGFYFSHRSGETYKRYSEYATPSLLGQVAAAKAAGKVVLMIAVGGGCNGNATGVVAAMTNSDFLEVPTTPLHYNDATTSAKKAFSLVVDDKILSKNLLGTFYLPRLVFCINETLLTSHTASIHSTVGESTKTMNMIGIADSLPGQRDYHNILGAHEFASDTTRIITCVAGFERLLEFLTS
eukprot:CAMPEP_0119401708 /NCGR_PEP_ID=MMETSP1334-20130426/142511_1 /TAXON_ID=127549 /ORGANISM="Calcidiscus leptoporus, Strain RCC1130" /LENGTH=608 /DNA_ID=CAMNT_0007425631 /DNA_START=51 /DNA_END=1875 /DNA_ORIENTATION=+